LRNTTKKETRELKNYSKDIDKKNPKQNLKKFTRKLILLNHIKYLSSNGVTVRDYLEKNPFPQRPFELKGSEEFMDYVKFNNFEMVSQALDKSIKYLYQYDYFQQTAFHWAAKLGYERMLEMFLTFSKRCNIYDKKMRTPLYLAAMNNQKRCVELLLNRGGNPFLCDKDGKKPEDVTTNTDIKILLQTTSEKPFTDIYNEDNNNGKNNKKKKSRIKFNYLK
jgi:ankyrin repeat protein